MGFGKNSALNFLMVPIYMPLAVAAPRRRSGLTSGHLPDERRYRFYFIHILVVPRMSAVWQAAPRLMYIQEERH